MTQRLTPGTAALLVTAPLLWAGNAVVGKQAIQHIGPLWLNAMRWGLALLLLLPLAWSLSIGLSVLATLCSWPINEKPLVRQGAAA